MSLFLGNLTPRVRRDEVERAFRRFGRCNVQLKDGYGFVHYDIPGNAEKALRALRGKNIGGEPINLTWANKQPKSFQRNMRGSRFYEPRIGRGFVRREDYGTRKINSHDQGAFRMASKQPHERDEELDANNFLNKGTGQSGDDIEYHEGESCRNAKETLVDQGTSIEPNLGENGRWGESSSNPLDGNEVENGPSFERYEPYHGYDRINEDKDNLVTNSHGSPALGSPREKAWREYPGEATSKPLHSSEPQQRCFVCGQMGHIKRNCPHGDSNRQGKFTKFDRRRENDASYKAQGKNELKRFRIEPWEKSKPSGKRHRRDENRKSSGLGKPERLITSKNTLVLKETPKSPLGRDSQSKKKYQQEVGGSTKYHRRKARASASSSRLSNSSTSSLCSHSHSSSRGTSPTSRSRRSRSRLVSSKSNSISSSSRSIASSSYSRSKGSRSRSRSRSPSSLSLSLSVSLGKPLTSSPNKALIEETSASPKGCFVKDAKHKRKRLLTDNGQLMDGDASLEICKQVSRNETLVEENRQTLKLEDKVCNNHQETWDEDEHHSHQKTVNEAKGPCMTPPQNGAFAANDLSFKNMVEKRDTEDCQPAATLDAQAPVEKVNPDVVTSQFENPSTVSSQEMYTVLKHYGLSVPQENERHFPVDAYFGSARLWPWEIIYYRRLKKGPISIENYARRIAQNEEFGIVDKYIRSSSGWGEGNRDAS